LEAQILEKIKTIEFKVPVELYLLCIQNKGREHGKPDQDGGENCFHLKTAGTSCTIPNMETDHLTLALSNTGNPTGKI